MEHDTPIRSFPSVDAARSAILKLEDQGIPCRVSTDSTGVMATLFVAAEHSEQAAIIIGEDGYDLVPPPESEADETSEITARTLPENILEQVTAELDAVAQTVKSPVRQIGILAISLILFFSLGLFRNSIMGVALLVGVIFIHELGHLVGMKLLKYADVQMFFIPFFGAAVSGRETKPRASRTAIISLLGPVPGILIGIATGIAYLRSRQPIFADATRTFLFINIFNLLPFHPLDGGRFFDAVLFSRHPKLEVGFKTLAALALGGLAFLFKDVFFGLFAFFAFMAIRGTYLSASIAYTLSKQVDLIPDVSSQRIPSNILDRIVNMLLAKLPVNQQNPKSIATFASGIWQRLRFRPCRVPPMIGLILCYLFFMSLGVASAWVFEIAAYSLNGTQTELVSRVMPNGETNRIYIVHFQGQKISETEVNEANYKRNGPVV